MSGVHRTTHSPTLTGFICEPSRKTQKREDHLNNIKELVQCPAWPLLLGFGNSATSFKSHCLWTASKSAPAQTDQLLFLLLPLPPLTSRSIFIHSFFTPSCGLARPIFRPPPHLFNSLYSLLTSPPFSLLLPQRVISFPCNRPRERVTRYLSAWIALFTSHGQRKFWSQITLASQPLFAEILATFPSHPSPRKNHWY